MRLYIFPFWGVPFLITISYVVFLVILPPERFNELLQEKGPYEWLQFFLIASAFLVSVNILRRPDSIADPLMKYWILAAAICSFYVAGEEISWGQHIFGWETPEGWAEINDHDETNLHNITQWVDQKPKTILEYSIIIGGLFVPWMRRYHPHRLPTRFDQFYPPAILAVTAACLLFSGRAKRSAIGSKFASSCASAKLKKP